MRHSERLVKPNILYVHSHDTGRYVQPYGHSVPTPNIQRLADQGLLLRQAFCAAPTSVRDSLYSLPPANLPDTPETRRDMASYKASARSLDHGVGAVLNVLDEQDLADETLVILTTDHGLAFPGAKTTLTDRGLGVMLIVRGPGGFHGGKVSEALVSQIDLFPTLCGRSGELRH
jgi:arylsulfatase A-like enzyme